MLIVRGDIADATQAPAVTAQILPQLAAVKASLPTGYRNETGGAVEESAKGPILLKKAPCGGHGGPDSFRFH